MWTQNESRILVALDAAVRSEAMAAPIDDIVSWVEQELQRRPDDVLAWKPIPLKLYGSPLPDVIRSTRTLREGADIASTRLCDTPGFKLLH